MQEKGGGEIHFKIPSLQGRKVTANMIFVVEDILMFMFKNKKKKSLANNFTLHRPDPPQFMTQ